MSDPIIVLVNRATDLADALEDATSALYLGLRVNVFVESAGAKTLLVRAIPARGEVLLLCQAGSSKVQADKVGAALRRHFDRVPDMLDAKHFERLI